jgi:hypothetical protein
MSRARIWLAALILIAGSAWLANQGVNHPSPETDTAHRRPRPTSMTGAEHRDLAGERQEFKQQRQEYFESLHRAAPGTDWRAIERENRRVLAEQRMAERRRLVDDGRYQSDGTVTGEFADRTVTGIWSEKGSNNLAGRMHVATIHEDVIYAGSSGGIVWRGAVDGSSWEPLNDWLRMPSIVAVEVLPDDQGGKRLLVFNGGANLIHTSDDDGVTWDTATGLSGPASWGGPRRADVLGDAGQTVFLLAQEWDYSEWHEAVGYYRSTDRGDSFQRLQLMNEQPKHADLWCPADSEGPGYLIRKQTVYSLDATGTLTEVATVPVTHSESQVLRTQLRGRTSEGGVDLYVAYSLSTGNTTVYRALLGSNVFSYAGSVPQTAFMDNSFGVSEERDGELYFGGVDTYRSTSYGTSWILVNNWWEYYDDIEGKLHADVPGITTFMVQGSEKAFICTDGGLYTSDDGLATVQNISLSGLGVSQYYDVYTHRDMPNVVYAGAQDQGFQRSTTAGDEPIQFVQTISGDYAHLVSGNGGVSLWCVYPGFAMYYPNAAYNTSARFWDFTMSGQFWLPPLMEDPNNPAVCWLGGGSTTTGAHLIRLSAGVSNITMTQDGHDFATVTGERISAMAYSPLETSRRYVMTDEGYFHYSTDSGSNWEMSPAFTGPGAHYFHGASIVASPVDAQTVWIGGSGYSNPPVYVSHDGGLSFTAMNTGLPSTLVYMLAVDGAAELLFAATEVGPYMCDLQTGQWTAIAGSAAPDQVYWCVEWLAGARTARFGTYGRGIWDFAVQSETPVEDQAPQAGDFALRAYPNPFNPNSRVRFDLPRDGHVSLDLYDVRGARVAEIFRGHLTAGRHEKPLLGERLASGVYLVRVSSGGQTQEVRVTLVK